jgi:hypothetical protein
LLLEINYTNIAHPFTLFGGYREKFATSIAINLRHMQPIGDINSGDIPKCSRGGFDFDA